MKNYFRILVLLTFFQAHASDLREARLLELLGIATEKYHSDFGKSNGTDQGAQLERITRKIRAARVLGWESSTAESEAQKPVVKKKRTKKTKRTGRKYPAQKLQELMNRFSTLEKKGSDLKKRRDVLLLEKDCLIACCQVKQLSDRVHAFIMQEQSKGDFFNFEAESIDVGSDYFLSLEASLQ